MRECERRFPIYRENRGNDRKYSPHSEVARFQKIAHIDWLQLITKNTVLIMRRGAENERRIFYELRKKSTVSKTS